LPWRRSAIIHRGTARRRDADKKEIAEARSMMQALKPPKFLSGDLAGGLSAMV